MLDGLRALRGGHGRGGAGIGGTGGHFAQVQARLRGKVVSHTAVGHGQGDAMLTRQHTDSSATGQKILHHLPSHIAGVGRHATRGQAVVGGKYHQLRGL